MSLLFFFIFIEIISIVLGLGDWPSHIAHMKDGTIVTFRDFRRNFPELDDTIRQQLELRFLNDPSNRMIADNRDDNDNSSNKKLSPEIISIFRKNMASPLLKVAEQWLRKDFSDVKERREKEKQKPEDERDKVLLGEENPKTEWDKLSEDVDTHGDKYYNYWND